MDSCLFLFFRLEEYVNKTEATEFMAILCTDLHREKEKEDFPVAHRSPYGIQAPGKCI